MSARRYDTTRIIKILLLVLSIVGIWFLYKKWLFEKKIRPRLLALIGDLGQLISSSIHW